MVAGSPTDDGNQVTSFRVRKIIQSIKEIVGNHSDADIYVVLKESNMDPNETAQKLLNQGWILVLGSSFRVYFCWSLPGVLILL